MKHISLGGLDVARIGLGAMPMSAFYNLAEINDRESVRTIHRALDLGVTHIDTAEIYGPFVNEELVGRAIKGRRDHVVLATKFGIVSHSNGGPGVLDSSPANIRVAVEGSLKRLGTDRIDLYYQHRVDPNTPIEDTVGALAELVAEGKVRYFTRDTNSGEFVFADTADELESAGLLPLDQQTGKAIPPKSMTFIGALVGDHPLESFRAQYTQELASLPIAEQERRLRGNWFVSEDAGKYFQTAMFPIVEFVHNVR